MKRGIKTLIFIIFFVCSLVFQVESEDIKYNKQVKIIKVKLKNLMKIKGEGKGYYLKLPIKIKTDKKGNIYLLDGSRGGWSFYEILKFNSKGKYIKKIVRRGQGPGEAVDIDNFYLYANKIYIYDYALKKIMIKNMDGIELKEFRIRGPKIKEKESISFLSIYSGKYYFTLSLINFTTKKTSIIKDRRFYCSYLNGKWIIGKTNIPKKMLFIRGSNGVTGIIPFGQYKVRVYKGKYLFITNSSKYNIKLYDMEKDRIIVEFSRRYKRIINYDDEKEGGGVMIAGKWYYAPHQKYKYDIQGMLTHKNKLWVITSTTDRKKGVLTDVFTERGEYINSFYLRLKNKVNYEKINDIPMFATYDYLYKIERNKYDEPTIMKYKIISNEDI